MGHEPRSAVEEALMDALRDAADDEGVASEELECVRDYSLSCPVGWVDLGGGRCARNTAADTDDCPDMMDYGGLTPTEKQARASRCNTEFACIGAYEPDYGQSCPDGWTLDLDKQCVAPTSYDG